MKTKERLDVDPLLKKTSPYIPDDGINFLFPFKKSGALPVGYKLDASGGF